VLRMKRLLISTAEFGLGMRPTNIDGLSRCAAIMQMASTAGKMAMTASLTTSGRRSATVHWAGTQCQNSLQSPKNRAAKKPIADQLKDKGPLPRGEAQHLRAGVAARPCAALRCVLFLDGSLHAGFRHGPSLTIFFIRLIIPRWSVSARVLRQR
jgi:hypothetical protein